MEGSKHWDSTYEWKIVTLLALGFGILGWDRFIVGPLLPEMMPDLGMNYAQAGIVNSALAVTWGVFGFVMGAFSDRFGRKPVVVGGIFVFSLLAVITGFVGSFTALLLVRTLLGIPGGAYCSTSIATTGDESKPSRRGLNMGIQQSLFPLVGVGIGPAVAGLLLGALGWRWLLVIGGLLGFLFAILLWRVMREPPAVKEQLEIRRKLRKHPPEALKETSGEKLAQTSVFRYRNVPICSVVMFFLMSGIFTLSVYVAVYFTDCLGFPSGTAALVTSAVGFGGFIGQLVVPGLSDHFGRRPVLFCFMMLTGISMALMLAVAANASIMLIYALVFLASTGGFGSFPLVTVVASESVPPAMSASAVGLPVVVGELLGGGLVPALAGVLADNIGIQGALYIAIIGPVTGAFTVLSLTESSSRAVERKALKL